VFDAAYDRVADLALVAEQHDLAALGLQQLVDQPLVGQRAVLEAPAAELVQPPRPLDGVVAV
jgi:hypothetical protein